ncbi:transglycosylase [Geodermatophilus sp. TF02-6]|uniref:resuscitation-promoting factor n=1 Tax=Geodermatophilus sp. TF02-6 TaxID=2250575 RepID=UPI000DE9709D|nr:resuscitation-promoting factor [Geodermatophilus sp. TF02-6]RBY76012.1 transglycosylase [Geodermatophilus sp. TF02-6]
MPRSLKLVLFALVLLGLVGGSVAFAAARKSLTLTVDGQARQVDTYADTVGEVLEEEGLQTRAHDVVLPDPGAAVGDGDTVVVNRARPLQLTVDGVQSEVYVTALSVDEALEQLGYRAEGLVVSASRSERLPLDGMALSITTPKEVTLVVDGQQRVVTTTAATAGDLLAEQGVTLGPTDRTSVPPDQALVDRTRLQVFRVRVSEVTQETAIAHGRVETDDPEAFEGERTVTRAGVDGERTTTYRVTVVDGVETEREQVGTQVTREPVDELVGVGTKERPAAAAPATSTSGLDWDALARCEAGGNWSIDSGNGYYGGLQFNQSTWLANGGGQYASYPHQATREQQIAVGERLYAARGASPWPSCGRRL